MSNTMTIRSAGLGMEPVVLDKGVQCGAGSVAIGDVLGATGELINVNAQLQQSGAGTFVIGGGGGYGAMTLAGGSNTFF